MESNEPVLSPDLHADFTEAKEFLEDFITETELDPNAVMMAFAIIISESCDDYEELNAALTSIATFAISNWKTEE